MKTLLWILPLALLLACDRLKIKSEVHGTVTNLADGTPLAGYEVHLVEKMTPLDLASPVTETVIATAMVGTNGHFIFEEELRRDSRRDYLVVFDPSGDRFVSNGTNTKTGAEVTMEANVEKEKDLQVVSLTALPMGYVEITLINNTGSAGQFEVFGRNSIVYQRLVVLELGNSEAGESKATKGNVAGLSEFIVKRSIDGQFVDSAVFEWFIPQNDTTLVELIINEP